METTTTERAKGIAIARAMKPGGLGIRIPQRVGMLASRAACTIARGQSRWLYVPGYGVAGVPLADLWDKWRRQYPRTAKTVKTFRTPEARIDYVIATHANATMP